jgi:hypothetical protein
MHDLHDRGFIAAGKAADITISDPDTIAPKPREPVVDLPCGGVQAHCPVRSSPSFPHFQGRILHQKNQFAQCFNFGAKQQCPLSDALRSRRTVGVFVRP